MHKGGEQKPRLLMIIPNYGTGGAQRIFSQHYAFLGEKYPTFQCVFNQDQPNRYAPDSKSISLGVPEGSHFLEKVYLFLRRLGRLSKLKKSESIDLSISHLEGADFLNVLTGKHDVKVTVLHGSKMGDVKYKGIYHFFRHYVMNPIVIHKANHIVCVSRGIRDEIVRLYNAKPNKVSVIHNFFETDKVLAASEQEINDKSIEALFANHDVLINCARLDIQKNQMALLDVFKQVNSLNQKVKLVLLGDGNDRTLLLERSAQLGFRTFQVWGNEAFDENFDVYFLGDIANPFPYIRQSKLFLLTSGWEGFPLVVGESLICGTPVISADCPTGPREFLAPGTELRVSLDVAEFAEFGVLMPLLNKKDPHYEQVCALWGETTVNLLGDKWKREMYSKAGKLRMEEFSKERIVQQWVKLIESLVVTKRKG